MGIAVVHGESALPARCLAVSSMRLLISFACCWTAFSRPRARSMAAVGVGVTTVNPGFVITPMTEKNRFKMPFLMTAEDAARIIADGLERGKRVIEFPRLMSMAMRLARILPAAVWDRVTGGCAKRKVDPEKAKR